MVTVNLVPTSGKVAYEDLRAHAPAGRLDELAGVGDAAFVTSSGPATGIDFYKADAFVAIVLITGPAGSASKDSATTLAKAAAGRI